MTLKVNFGAQLTQWAKKVPNALFRRHPNGNTLRGHFHKLAKQLETFFRSFFRMCKNATAWTESLLFKNLVDPFDNGDRFVRSADNKRTF